MILIRVYMGIRGYSQLKPVEKRQPVREPWYQKRETGAEWYQSRQKRGMESG
jgi:hypothetical protein